jgi:hypothetical protein
VCGACWTSSGKTAALTGSTGNGEEVTIIEFAHRPLDVVAMLFDPSTMTSLNPLWLPVLMAEGEDPSITASPVPLIIVSPREVVHSNGSSSSVPVARGGNP